MFSEFIWDKDIFLKTDYPIALDSPNHIDPYGGTQQDKFKGDIFARQLLEKFPNRRKLLDLGCATGTIPESMRFAGMLAVGIEGSNIPQIKKIEAWSRCPEILRTCDISRNFEVTDLNGNHIKFDWVTMWDVLEHIHPDRLNICFNNIRKLLNRDGYAILDIGLGFNKWHQSYFTTEKWDKILSKNFSVNNDIRNHLWKYCRPSPEEMRRANIKEIGLYNENHIKYLGRIYRWCQVCEIV